MARGGEAIGMRDGYLRGALSPRATQRQMDVLAAFVAAGGSVQDAADLVDPTEHGEAPPRRPASAIGPHYRAADRAQTAPRERVTRPTFAKNPAAHRSRTRPRSPVGATVGPRAAMTWRMPTDATARERTPGSRPGGGSVRVIPVRD